MNSRQAELPGLQYALSNRSHRAVGTLGEHYAAALLASAGYVVGNTQPGQKRGDLLAVDPDTGECIRVEVKTARRAKNGQWQFLLHKHDRHGRTSCHHADVVILLCALKTGRAVPFVIPCNVIGKRQRISISSYPTTYAGKWAQYRQRPHQLTLEVQQ